MGKVFIYGVIGREVKAAEIVKQIAEDKEAIEVYINSPGGNVYEGWAIFNALERHGNVSTFIDGLAYSAASWIALAAPREKRFMAQGAQFGIHQAINFQGGNKDELQAQIEMLGKIDKAQIDIYKAKTELKEKDIISIMEKDTPLSFEEALSFGFVSGEYKQEKLVALFNIDKNMDLFEKMASIFSAEASSPELIKEEADKEAKEALEKAESVNDQLHAQFAGKSELDAFKNSMEPFVEAILEKWEKLPTKEDIDRVVEAKTKLAVTQLMAEIKSKGSVPAPEETAFAKAEEQDNFAPLTLKKNNYELLNSNK